jgi:aspartate kinase
MATFGAKVLHPATLLPAMQQNIPVYVLNSRNVNSRGTRIRALVSSSRTLFRAIAAKKKISIVYIVADRMLRSHGFLYAVFEVFKRHGVPVDIVATSEVSVSLTVESKQATPELLADLRTLAQATYEHDKAIVCLVGKNIRGKPGVAAKVFSAVARAGINVRMISQGASEINVSFVIDERDVPAAVRALHARFFRRASRPPKSVLPQVNLPPGSAWTSSAEAAAGD